MRMGNVQRVNVIKLDEEKLDEGVVLNRPFRCDVKNVG